MNSTFASTEKSDEYRPLTWKPGLLLDSYLETIEENILNLALTISNNNQVQAAELLGVHRGTLQYKLKKHDLTKKKAS